MEPNSRLNRSIIYRIFLLIAMLVNATDGFGQQASARKNDIFYYPDSTSITDTYQKSQCKLDIYYPKILGSIFYFRKTGPQ